MSTTLVQETPFVKIYIYNNGNLRIKVKDVELDRIGAACVQQSIHIARLKQADVRKKLGL
jgi:hypothetical protein